ncbi:hypothetical protein GCM10007036_14080 [Alsobacter metallidurans]|uniref:Uncharacterized protein n=1 Tax=Alsobacter metallidurans TaxID=340221 RepID=A0A917I5X1_9HYPH|nr:hypothetical protein [Alsobacter metallidurans]GGH14629.1 hypothetical protein GCM10007036_14080 [Alsobacter metallidurans]
MRAYLISAENFTVTEVEHAGDLASIYAHLGCDHVDTLRMPRGDAIYFADEIEEPGDRFFTVVGTGALIAGKGLFVGSDDEGKDAEPSVEIAQLARVVRFLVSAGRNLHSVIPEPVGVIPEPTITVTALERAPAAGRA